MALGFAVVFSRLWALDADPSSLVHPEIMTDEGWWAHNARNFLLTGRWILDEHNPPLWMAPLHTLLVWASLESFGPSLWATRLPGALAGIILWVAGARMLVLSVPGRWAWAGAVLLGMNGFLWSHARVGFVETLQLACLSVGAWAALSSSLSDSRPWQAGRGAIAALFLVLSALAKPSGVPVAVAIGVWLVWEGLRRRTAAALIGFAAGAVFASGVIGAAFVLPNADAILGDLLSQSGSSFGGHSWLRTFLSFGHTYHPGEPLMLVALAPCWWALVIAVTFRGLAGERPLATGLARMAWLWLVLAALLTASQFYQPDRRMLLAAPPLVFLLVLHLSAGIRLPGRPDASFRAIDVLLPFAMLTTGLALAGFVGVFGFWREVFSGPEGARISGRAIAVLVWLSAGGGAALMLWGLHSLPWPGIRVHAAWLLVPLLLLEGVHAARGLAAPAFSVRDAALDVARRIDAEEPICRVIQGKIANTLALESHGFAFHTRQWRGGIEMNLDGWRRYRPRFVVVGRRDDGRVWAPPVVPPVEKLERVATYPLWQDASGRARLSADLYRVPDALGPCRDVREAARPPVGRDRSNPETSRPGPPERSTLPR